MSLEIVDSNNLFALPYNPDLFLAPVPTLDGPVSAIELAALCHESEYARYMDEHQPYRFEERFGYDRTRMIADLGDDVVPTRHQVQTGLYAAMVLTRLHALRGEYPIPEEDLGTVVLASMTHDFGENLHPDIVEEAGCGVGDIPFGMKTESDLAMEAVIRRVFFKRTLPRLDPDALARIEGIITHDKTVNGSEIHEASHDLETFNTALLAGRAVTEELTLFDNQPVNPSMAREPNEFMCLVGIANAIFTSMDDRFAKWTAHLQLGDRLPLLRAQVRLPEAA